MLASTPEAMPHPSPTTLESRLLPAGLALAGVAAAAAFHADRPGPAAVLLGVAWLTTAGLVVRAAPRSPAARLLALALLAGGLGVLVPVWAMVAAWVLLACLLATSAVREALDGWQVVVDALLIGSSVAAIILALGGASHAGSQGLPWIAVAAAAIAAPWVGACTRGAGSTTGTLLALSAAAALVGAVACPVAVPEALMAGAGLGLVARMAGCGVLVAPRLVGSPAQQRRCGRARVTATLVIPLAAVLIAAVVALHGEPIPAVQVVTLAMLGSAAILRTRFVSGESSASGCEAPGLQSSERLAALAEYSRLVAHEVRNSLSVLYSTADLLRRDRDEAQRLELLDVLAEEGDRVRDVIDQLTTFAGEGAGAPPSPLRLREIARSAARRAVGRTGWPEGLTVELDLGRGDDVVEADAQGLELAVSHVLFAAAQGGTRRLQVATRAEGSKRSLVVEGDGCVSADIGRPTPSRLLSAETDAEGSLGLAVAQRTVIEHGGELRLSVPETGGLRAVIELPAEAG